MNHITSLASIAHKGPWAGLVSLAAAKGVISKNYAISCSTILIFSFGAIAELPDTPRIYGKWAPDNGYGEIIENTNIYLTITKSSITYQNQQGTLNCPINNVSHANGIINIRCFSEYGERVRFAITGGAYYHSLFGFEFWVGGVPNSPDLIHGGIPASFSKIK